MRAYLSIIWNLILSPLFRLGLNKKKENKYIEMMAIIAATVVAGKAIIIVFSSDLSEHSARHTRFLVYPMNFRST